MTVNIYPANFNLTDLNGKNGFVLNGIQAYDWSGISVASAGDVNGDGINDVIIGAYDASPNGQNLAGQSYVVFGHSGVWSAVMNLSSLNGKTGFILNGAAFGESGISVASAGDVNDDGINDVIIGANYAPINGQNQAGQSYVVFGRSGVWPAAINVSSLNGRTGFALNGIKSGDHSGVSVASAGDVNGDGISDVIIGANWAPNGQAGQSYVVFGRSGVWPAAMNLSSLNGSTGFALNGIKPSDSSGVSVASAGDINGDGINDMIIGAYHAKINVQAYAGQSYVVFGRSGVWPAAMNLSSLNGSTGFALNGIQANDYSGVSVASAGDVNGDGITDVIIGAYLASPNGQSRAGQSYVVFGRSAIWPAAMNLNSLNGSTGFALNGINVGDQSGVSVASAGDVNGDGISDVIIGARYASSNGQNLAGQSYVVFGRSNVWPAVMNLSSLNGSTGFALNGIKNGDYSGCSVASAGDVNSDGISDVIIGAYFAASNRQSGTGQSYVVFGDQSISLISNQLTVMQGQAVILNNNYLSANSGNFNSSLLQYSVSNVQYGQFELLNNRGFAISNFTQAQINAGLVRFVHDGSSNSPSYSVVAQTGIGLAIPPAPQAVNVSFSVAPVVSAYPTSFNLADLNGKNGFMLNGINPSDQSGLSVASAGDINNDGISDVIIGAHLADPNGQTKAGQSYVIFGRTGVWPATMNLNSLNGSTGCILNGMNANDQSGSSVASAGDINGDGINDVIIGAPYASRNGQAYIGQSYVVFGRTDTWPAVISLGSLNGITGFVLNGIQDTDYSGNVASAGDVNNDGIVDVIIGAMDADPNGLQYAGQSYVVFGRVGVWPAVINLNSLNGISGFILNGIQANDQSGLCVASAGDINGDGINDVIIGAPFASRNGQQAAGQSYVVFGRLGVWPAAINLNSLDGITGFILNGIKTNGWSGLSVASVGDINGDAIVDLIIGSIADQSYVIFGRVGAWPAVINLNSLDGSIGFVLNGATSSDGSGRFVASAGDINGDGVNDVIIGAPNARPNGQINVGQSYVVFGRSGVWPAAINLSSLNGSTGFVLNGIKASDYSGICVASAGDINGDGIPDMIVGAYGASPNGQASAGQSYVIFGDRTIPLINNQLTVGQGRSIILNNTTLSANSGSFTSSLVQYSVTNVQHGQFELLNNPGIAINNFTQTQLNSGLVRFVQDGSVNKPNYSVVAQTGIGFAIPPAPQAANVSFSFVPSTSTSMQSSVITSTTSNALTLSSSPSISSSSMTPASPSPSISSTQSSASVPFSSTSASGTILLASSSSSNPPSDTPTISVVSSSSASSSSAPISQSQSLSPSSTSATLSALSSSSTTISSSSIPSSSSQSPSISLTTSSQNLFFSSTSPIANISNASIVANNTNSPSTIPLLTTPTSPTLVDTSNRGSGSGISSTIIAAVAGAGGGVIALAILYTICRHRNKQRVALAQSKDQINMAQNHDYLPESKSSIDNPLYGETRIDEVIHAQASPHATPWTPSLYAVSKPTITIGGWSSHYAVGQANDAPKADAWSSGDYAAVTPDSFEVPWDNSAYTV